MGANAKAKISQQTTSQRNQYVTTFGDSYKYTNTGVFSSVVDADNQFGSVNGDNIEFAANEAFSNLYSQGISGSDDQLNPDFANGHNKFGYDDVESMFNNVASQTDSPSTLGPNIKTQDINNPQPAEGSELINHLPANVAKTDEGGLDLDSQVGSEGFGVSSTNISNMAKRENPYFTETSKTLGEYIDNENYAWTIATSDE